MKGTTFEIALRSNQLPDTIDELVPMMFAGQAAVRFMSAKLKAVSDKSVPDPLGILEKQRQKTLDDGQCMGEMLLKVMGRIGELSKEMKPEPGPGRGIKRLPGERGAFSYGTKKAKALGLKSRRQLQEAQMIANNPKLVDAAIKEARDRPRRYATKLRA